VLPILIERPLCDRAGTFSLFAEVFLKFAGGIGLARLTVMGVHDPFRNPKYDGSETGVLVVSGGEGRGKRIPEPVGPETLFKIARGSAADHGLYSLVGQQAAVAIAPERVSSLGIKQLWPDLLHITSNVRRQLGR
jgi:hypothetical protein